MLSPTVLSQTVLSRQSPLPDGPFHDGPFHDIAVTEAYVPDNALDYLVIGAGPAGLQLGYFLEKAGRGYLILEAGPTPGTFFRTFPRHRTLISINKKYTGTDDPELNLRMDWNSLLSDDPDLLFTRYSDRYFPAADDMVRYLADFAAACGLRIVHDTRAVHGPARPARAPSGDRRARPDVRGASA